VSPGRIGEPVLEPAFPGEDQQPFAVGIEASGGIDGRNIDEVGKGAPGAARLGAELAEDAVGLVEQQSGQGGSPTSVQAPSRRRQRLTTPMEINSSPRSIETGGRIIGMGEGMAGRPYRRIPILAGPYP
jgi:hypothetical protein